MGTCVASGIVFVITPVGRSNTAADERPAVPSNITSPIRNNFFDRFRIMLIISLLHPFFFLGQGLLGSIITLGCSIIIKVSIPPGNMLLLVSSFSLWECHMKTNPELGLNPPSPGGRDPAKP